MKILLDHNAPLNIARHLPHHEIKHTSQIGWGQIENGELLKAAEAAGFDVLITADKGIRHQQNLSGRLICVLALSTNNWPLMKPHVGTIVQAIENLTPGTYRAIYCGGFARVRRRTE